MTLADEIARAAVVWAKAGDMAWAYKVPDRAHRFIGSRRWWEYVAYARGLLDARTPSPNSPATGGRMAQEWGLAPGEGNPPGLTMPPLW